MLRVLAQVVGHLALNRHVEFAEQTVDMRHGRRQAYVSAAGCNLRVAEVPLIKSRAAPELVVSQFQELRD